MSAATATAAAVHVLVFPYPAQGHMIPLLDFTHHLAARCGVAVTVVVTPQNLRQLNPLLAAHPRSVTALVLPFPAHPAIPAGVENTVDLPAGGFRHMMVALEGLRHPIADWFRTHPSPPAAIISDMFLGWTNHLAAELGVPGYAFFPSGFFAISFIRSLWCQSPELKNGDDRNTAVGFPEIPNSPIYPWWQLSPIFRSYVRGDPKSEFIKDSFLANFVKSHGLVGNTFYALEGVYSQYLKKVLGHNRVWAIGPVLPRSDPIHRGGPSSISPDEILSWLDTCQDRSVVYICFGSQAVLTNKQMAELAAGLEKSTVKFILSVKAATQGHAAGMYGALPPGFDGRVAGRGLVIRGWAPQVLILRNTAVSAFLTHCGWNSVLESIAAGVPMLAWPMEADQFLNATLLVDQLGVAVRVCEGRETVLPAEDLVRFLEGTVGDEWSEKTARAAALRKAAADAVSDGGSSVNDLEDFATELCGAVSLQ
ncbi:UDP-glycosyltransferase 89B2 [Andrographis paniculata]|uniref:Glycosyltransferase n=1 Tax=Andrographis paniculata TaxID=175694 RepID=A0A8E3S624_ANDPA|nr:UDP-glycosyltransferase 89B2 [Andrographis paniculata]QDA11336.1 UDP-glycosyltransferase [Andrographis paniculata]